MICSVDVARSAIRDLSKLPKNQQELLKIPIIDLGLNPFPEGYKKLKGFEIYRIRKGDYRILYEFDKRLRQVRVSRVQHRSDVYRG